MPTFAMADLSDRESYFLVTSVVVPRPIAWVSTAGADRVPNLAPYSYFSGVSSAPPIIQVTSSGRKDTLRNVEATGEFVVNVVGHDLVEQMNLTATDFPAAENEFAWAGLTPTPSDHVGVPRVAEAKVSIECTLHRLLPMGRGTMIFGDVIAIHVEDDVMKDGRVDAGLLRPVGRLGGSWYTQTTTSSMMRLQRGTWAELQDSQSKPGEQA